MSDYPKPFTLARPECCAWLAAQRLAAITDKPTAHQKRQAIEMLEACARHGYGPPAELIALVAKVAGADAHTRDAIGDKAAFFAAARLRAEQPDISVRALAKAVGVPHKTADNWISGRSANASRERIGYHLDQWKRKLNRPLTASERDLALKDANAAAAKAKAADFQVYVTYFRGEQ